MTINDRTSNQAHQNKDMQIKSASVLIGLTWKGHEAQLQGGDEETLMVEEQFGFTEAVTMVTGPKLLEFSSISPQGSQSLTIRCRSTQGGVTKKRKS